MAEGERDDEFGYDFKTTGLIIFVLGQWNLL